MEGGEGGVGRVESGSSSLSATGVAPGEERTGPLLVSSVNWWLTPVLRSKGVTPPWTDKKLKCGETFQGDLTWQLLRPQLSPLTLHLARVNYANISQQKNTASPRNLSGHLVRTAC